MQKLKPLPVVVPWRYAYPNFRVHDITDSLDKLRHVPDPPDSPTFAAERNTPAERRLHYRRVTENPDHLGMLFAMVATINGIHPEIRVGAVAYDAAHDVFGPAACNGLNDKGQAISQEYHPYLLTNENDKEYTVCAEIRAMNQAVFLKKDTSQSLNLPPYQHWRMYSTRIPCKRCREAIARGRPEEIVIHKQTTDWLLAQKRGYQDSLDETLAFFGQYNIPIRHVDLPKEFIMRLMLEVMDDFPFGTPYKRPYRLPERRSAEEL